MSSKEAVESCSTTERGEPPAPLDPSDATARKSGVPPDDGAAHALPARFREGTAWDEV